MRLALLALLLGCSSSLPVTDASTPDVSHGAPDDAPDATPPPDAPSTPDAGAVDASPEASADVTSVVDAQLPPDVTEPVDVPTVDAVAVADVPQEDAVDVAVMDTPDDTVAVPDVPEPMDVVDVQPDRPDVVDVPRDTGPQDAGPVTYDLNAARTALEVTFVGRYTLPPSPVSDCPTATRDASCSITGDTLNFSVVACYTTFTGLIRLGDAGGSSVSVGVGCVGGCGSATTLRVRSGNHAGLRRSVHLQLAAPPFRGASGIEGAPGRTVDPSLADLWLLGCEVR